MTDYSKYRAIAKAVIAKQEDEQRAEMERRIKEYSDYVDWYDNGPGSESWKRKHHQQMTASQKVAFWPEWKKRAAYAALGIKFEKKEKKVLEDELFEI